MNYLVMESSSSCVGVRAERVLKQTEVVVTFLYCCVCVPCCCDGVPIPVSQPEGFQSIHD